MKQLNETSMQWFVDYDAPATKIITVDMAQLICLSIEGVSTDTDEQEDYLP